ncbi:hypothetical protein Poli38472_002955 [Pythium oligandrum]|uniref:Uncharacterized protein n=1 Tax=Pythium oligandrum TaxID=41045 RepID=A0A8K1FB93_PYTOL|nr:hypothetical protein Poli38472_002955 [Pythium oligandrum]|eukprot:TMW57030.1 hypothetical protein Poli38472_002955 [Pythium oligandrum]
MATIYRSGSPSRFAFAQSHAHAQYTARTLDPATQLQMQMRYSSYALDGHSIPLPATPPPPGVGLNGLSMPAPPGATLGLSSSKNIYGGGLKGGMYPTSISPSPLYVNPLVQKVYPPQPSEMLLVTPGVPTPVELSIYENKQPTGLLHVTIGNQTVEFLDGVANMPQKR